MKKIILLTNARTGEKILIGTESIITAEITVLQRHQKEDITCTRIDSRHAMVISTYVKETPEEIYELSK